MKEDLQDGEVFPMTRPTVFGLFKRTCYFRLADIGSQPDLKAVINVLKAARIKSSSRDWLRVFAETYPSYKRAVAVAIWTTGFDVTWHDAYPVLDLGLSSRVHTRPAKNSPTGDDLRWLVFAPNPAGKWYSGIVESLVGLMVGDR